MIQKTIKFCLLISLCLLKFGANAKDRSQAETPEEIKESVEYTLHKLDYFDSINNIDSLNFYLDIGKQLCSNTTLSQTKVSDLHYYIGHIYSYIGSGYYRNNDMAEALLAYENAMAIFKLVGIKYELARSLNNMALIYMKIGNQTKSLDLLYKSTSLFIDINNYRGIALGYNSISKIFRDKDDLEKTQEYLDKALIFSRKLKDNDVLATVLNSIAGLKKEMGDKKAALSLYREALSISKNARSKMKFALILNNLGVIHKEMGELEEAKTYFERAYKISIDNNSNSGIVFTLVNLADYYYLTGNYLKANKLGKEAFDLSKEAKNDEGKYKAVVELIKISEKQKNWAKTAYFQKILIAYADKKEKQILEQVSQQGTMRCKLEKERIIISNNEAKAKLTLEKHTQRINFIYTISGIILFVLLVFLLNFYIRLRTSKVTNKNITKQSEERKLLLQEVHHRVKNNFQIVSSMLRLQSYNFENEELRQNFEEAVNRINSMAIVHDVIYRQEKFSDIDSKTYLEKLVKNLHKMGDSRIIISIDSEEIPFKIETLINLGIALNELITNSFKHAFNSEIIKPEIKIALHTIGDKTYELIYKDNGVGINKDSYTSSFGMELIETIISNFDGEVVVASEKKWNTLIKITFKEI